MNKKPANGMRDILPGEMELRRSVLQIVRDTYTRYGFQEIETPVVESLPNLSSNQGGENEKLIFKILKRGEKLDLSGAKEADDLSDLGLRYDLTLPLSRYFANHENELRKPFKALQIGPVFRAERPQKGRFREFYQCDIDILGDGTNLAETELILATSEAVAKIGFKDFVIRLNDRRILRSLAERAGVPEEKYDALLIALDKLDKIGKDGVLSELRELGLSDAESERFLDLPESLDELDFADPEVAENLKKIMGRVEQVKKTGFTLRFDPTLVRGMGYYTGPIFEVAVPEFGSSIGGGGRYDRMVGRFLGHDVPAVGFSLGFERIISILLDRGNSTASDGRKTALLLERDLPEEKCAEAFREAAELREKGFTVIVEQMNKNRKFQVEELEKAGYTDVRFIYSRPVL